MFFLLYSTKDRGKQKILRAHYVGSSMNRKKINTSSHGQLQRKLILGAELEHQEVKHLCFEEREM